MPGDVRCNPLGAFVEVEQVCRGQERIVRAWRQSGHCQYNPAPGMAHIRLIMFLYQGLLRSVSPALRWTATYVMGSAIMTAVLQRTWRSDVRSPHTTGRLLVEVLLHKELTETTCPYWAGDQISQPSEEVQTKGRRDVLWKETQEYFVKHKLLSKEEAAVI